MQTDKGLCNESNADVFFPELGQSSFAARKICEKCPIRAECLKGAIDRNEEYGVWGGYALHTRKRIKKELGSKASLEAVKWWLKSRS